MKARAFLSLLGRKYPKRITFVDDVLGLCGAKISGEINSVIITLDCDEEAVDLAIKTKSNLIISHHPLLYPSNKEALENDRIRDIYQKLLDNNISLYVIHTNFDLSLNGMNARFGQKLGLINVKPLDNTQSFLYTGELENELNLDEFLKMFKHKLELKYVLYQVGKNATKKVKKIGFILGSASNLYSDAISSGCDIYISGDSKHHIRREIYHEGLNFIELPHEYEQEIFIKTMSEVVNMIDPNIQIHLSYSQKYHNIF